MESALTTIAKKVAIDGVTDASIAANPAQEALKVMNAVAVGRSDWIKLFPGTQNTPQAQEAAKALQTRATNLEAEVARLQAEIAQLSVNKQPEQQGAPQPPPAVQPDDAQQPPAGT